ncbi:hypothetical protein [Sphingomonas sp. Leaf343]|uniref:hypothetical protein n=1 Tax=Sphingomonas sp. Leaf343 TaxID=1736345 RepID=UPI0007008E18|nr:hypothetical protein [Sphingomonas sp. Leaf343]KQR82202.1 hypothetical protein ASG07_10985 [Sphingomonas sp. Leaf343]
MGGLSAALPAAVLAWVSAAPAIAADTRAGTAITNTAQLRYDVDGTVRSQSSNTVTIVVAERLDIGLAHDGGMVTIDTAPVSVPVQLTNQGTGQEAFIVTAGTSTPATTVQTVAIDIDGDGRFDADRDTVLTGATPVLAPGETLPLVAVLAPAAGTVAADGSLTVTAEAATGHGQPEQELPGLGDDGSDAIVGETGAIASAAIPFVATASTTPTLVKSQAVAAADGSPLPAGATAGAGAVVTYTLVARIPADAALSAATIDDPVPADAVYLPGSMTLDDAVLSDAADGDAGGFDGRAVSIRLPDRSGGAATAHTVRFKVRLQ